MRRASAAVLLGWAVLIVFARPGQAGDAPTPPPRPSGRPGGVVEGKYPVFSDARYREDGPAFAVEALREVMLEHELSYSEAFDYGTAWFLKQRWERATVAYEAAVPKAANAEEKALACLAAAQSAAMGKNFAEAGRLANRAQLLVPGNGAVAASRLAFWSSADDRLEARVAGDMVKRLNVHLDGEEVCEPGTIVVVACLAVAGAITMYAIHEGLLSTEEVLKILRDLIIAVPTSLLLGQAVVRGDTECGFA